MKDIVLYSPREGVWAAETMRLPGYTAYGRTEEEVLKRLREAVTLYYPCGECGGGSGEDS